MNYGVVVYLLGTLLKLEGVLLSLPFVVGLVYREKASVWYLLSAGICVAVGFLLTIKKAKRHQVYAKEGFICVGLAWLVLSLFGAIPFVLAGDIPNYLDALFEMVSGFTTTGSSILTAVEPLSHASLFWRSFSHWVGGMGIVVFMLAILPLLGGNTMNLMKAESPGPVVGKLVPKIRGTAGMLYGIYLLITVVEFVLLAVFGMPVFEAMCHTFGTVGTGGFGVLNTGYMNYSPALQNITTVFMIICGVNFQFYFLVATRKLRNALKMEEVKIYFLIIFASVAMIAVNLRHFYGTIGETLRHAFFQVGTIITTTGYATTDFNLWPQFSKTVLLILMMIGACAGSTGGGLKVSRLCIWIKMIKREIGMIIHPRSVKNLHMDGASVSNETVRSTSVYIAVYFMIFFVSVLLVSVDEFDFTTNFSAVAATLNNIGPGFNLVGPAANFSLFSPFSKIVLIFDMLAGRLELFPMLMLFSVKSWKKYN